MARTMWLFLGLFAALVAACDNDTKKSAIDEDLVADEQEATDEDTVIPDKTEETPDLAQDEILFPDTDGGFDPENSGYNIFFQIMTMDVFGQVSGMAFGLFLKTAREDLVVEEEELLALDTCVFEAGGETPTPSCTSKDDCAPEQECLPETDNNGNPIAGSDRCVTPDRESLDRGPVTITGFTGGPATFAYEPNDKVYKKDGTGDGSVPVDILAFDATYELSGEGMDDLAAFSASVYFPPALKLTAPEPHDGTALPIPAITVDTTKDLTVTWDGADPDGTIEVSMTGESGSVVCRATDDGSFTIPADLIGQITFGTGFGAMANNLILDRKYSEKMEGKSVTAGSFDTEQMMMIMVEPVTGQ